MSDTTIAAQVDKLRRGFIETIETLTGYEEKSIEERFGLDIATLLDNSGTTTGRALIFIEKVRAGAKSQAAYKSAMELTIKQVGDHFEEDADEVLPDEPVTEQGKGDSEPE